MDQESTIWKLPHNTTSASILTIKHAQQNSVPKSLILGGVMGPSPPVKAETQEPQPSDRSSIFARRGGNPMSYLKRIVQHQATRSLSLRLLAGQPASESLLGPTYRVTIYSNISKSRQISTSRNQWQPASNLFRASASRMRHEEQNNYSSFEIFSHPQNFATNPANFHPALQSAQDLHTSGIPCCSQSAIAPIAPAARTAVMFPTSSRKDISPVSAAWFGRGSTINEVATVAAAAAVAAAV